MIYSFYRSNAKCSDNLQYVNVLKIVPEGLQDPLNGVYLWRFSSANVERKPHCH